MWQRSVLQDYLCEQCYCERCWQAFRNLRFKKRALQGAGVLLCINKGIYTFLYSICPGAYPLFSFPSWLLIGTPAPCGLHLCQINSQSLSRRVGWLLHKGFCTGLSSLQKDSNRGSCGETKVAVVRGGVGVKRLVINGIIVRKLFCPVTQLMPGSFHLIDSPAERVNWQGKSFMLCHHVDLSTLVLFFVKFKKRNYNWKSLT